MLAFVLVACALDRIVNVSPDSQSRTIFAAVGEEIRITFGNVGGAEYESPPQISSNAVAFLSVDVIPPFNPGGPTQQFRFRAASRGAAVVRFRRLFFADSVVSVVSVVEDTIQVR